MNGKRCDFLHLKKSGLKWMIPATFMLACSTSGNNESGKIKEEKSAYAMGTYGYDVAFFAENEIETIELKDAGSKACVLVIPAYQGRVMTSSADGNQGISFGWINYDYIRSGKLSNQFNPFGGEERLWFGPEGGPFSIYFEEGKEQVFANWKVPDLIDLDTFDILKKEPASVSFGKSAFLRNASGTGFRFEIERTVSLLSAEDVSELLNMNIPPELNCVAYQTDNTIRNTGNDPWTRENGLLSIWMLSMFNPTESTTVFIPYNQDTEGTIVNDDYFGKVPSDRLIVEDGMIYFKIDGKYRSKIGIPYNRATPFCGSYDSDKKVLTLLWCSLPPEPRPYVNSKWGPQDDPYNGDAINSYNDGPVEDGSIMGPFYEIETSSPGAQLKPGESLVHTQRIMHFQGNEAALEKIVSSLFDPGLREIAGKFK